MSAYLVSAPSIFLVCSAILCAGLAIHAFTQHRSRFAHSYAALMTCSALYGLGYGLEIASPDLAQMKVMLQVQYIGLPFIPLAWIALCWSYMDPRGLPAQVFYALLFLSCLIFLLVQSNDSHHLYYADLSYSLAGNLSIAQIIKGPSYWAYIAYLNLSTATGVLLLFRAWQQSTPLYHRQARWMLIGSFLPWLFHLIYQFGLSPYGLDLSPFGLLAAGVCFSLASFKYNILDVLPLVRNVVFEDIAEGVIVLDTRNRIVDFNLAAKRFVSGLDHQYIGLPLSQLKNSEGFSDAALASHQFEFSPALPGEERHFQVRSHPIHDRRGQIICKTILIQDISEKKKLNDQLIHMAYSDELTGIFNRRHLLELSNREFQLARRHTRPLSIIMIDVDYFKEINDSLGHQAGDKLLTQLAGTIKERLRATDIFGRYGGDEFVVTLPETSAEDAHLIATQLILACLDECNMSLSMGIAELRPETADFSTLLREADKALYQTKAGGRGQVAIYSPTH